MKRVFLLFVALSFAGVAVAQGTRHRMGLKQPRNWQNLTTWDGLGDILGDPLPSSFNWNDEHVLQPVRNQGNCGSCWAFSTTAVAESLFRIAYPEDESTDLAEQETLSCSRSGSCSGGYFHAFNYIVNHGVGLEEDFPYQARNLSCRSIPKKAQLAEWHYIGTNKKSASITQMKQALLNYGPISVDVNGGFGSYSSGVYTSCGSTSTNHMVTIEGYVDDPAYEAYGGGYWIMRNSWGESWGEKGYMRIVYQSRSGRKCNGIGGVSAYATLEGIPNLKKFLQSRNK